MIAAPVLLLAVASQVSCFPTLDHMRRLVNSEIDAETIGAIAKLQSEAQEAGILTKDAVSESPIDSKSFPHRFSTLIDILSLWRTCLCCSQLRSGRYPWSMPRVERPVQPWLSST